jgi:hypothetical protein
VTPLIVGKSGARVRAAVHRLGRPTPAAVPAPAATWRWPSPGWQCCWPAGDSCSSPGAERGQLRYSLFIPNSLFLGGKSGGQRNQ